MGFGGKKKSKAKMNKGRKKLKSFCLVSEDTEKEYNLWPGGQVWNEIRFAAWSQMAGRVAYKGLIA